MLYVILACMLGCLVSAVGHGYCLLSEIKNKGSKVDKQNSLGWMLISIILFFSFMAHLNFSF
ncbi:hypothetical protein MAWWA_22 [Bacillus phage vB_BspH_Mawwa]|nr:hypothetical protein MAWWA_22 [Bacillus phage vB_BspH_Mawwa]